MKKRLTALALFLVFAALLVPGLAFADGGDLTAVSAEGLEQETFEYDLWVGGVQVTADNASNVTGDGISGKVSYDASTNTLTLSNASVTGTYYREAIGSEGGQSWDLTFEASVCYFGTDPLTVWLEGDNKLTVMSSSETVKISYGIAAGMGGEAVDLAFAGSGTLSIECKGPGRVFGIVCNSLEIAAGAFVNVSAESQTTWIEVIRSYGVVTVRGALSATSTSSRSTGVRGDKGIEVPKGGSISVTIPDMSSGISLAFGNMTVNGFVEVATKHEDKPESKAKYGSTGIEGYGKQPRDVTVGATGELLISSTSMACENINLIADSKTLSVLAGNSEDDAELIAISNLNYQKWLHVRPAKKPNTMTVKTKPVTFKASKVKTKARSVKASKAFSVKNAKGPVRYELLNYRSEKKMSIAKNGKVTVKKGAAKRNHWLQVKVVAAGDSEYEPITKTVELLVTVA